MLENQIQTLIRSRQYQNALAIILEALTADINPGLKIRLLVYQATCALHLKRYAACLDTKIINAATKQQLQLASNDLNYIWLMYATSHASLGNYDAALSMLSNQTEASTIVYLRSQLLKASVLLQLERYIQAEHCLLRIDINDKNDALKEEFYLISGILQFKLGHKQKSLASLSAAFALVSADEDVTHSTLLKVDALKILAELKIETEQYSGVNLVLDEIDKYLKEVPEVKNTELTLEILFLKGRLHAGMNQDSSLFEVAQSIAQIYEQTSNHPGYQASLCAELLVLSTYFALKVNQLDTPRDWLAHRSFHETPHEILRMERDLAHLVLSYMRSHAWAFQADALSLTERLGQFKIPFYQEVVRKWFGLLQSPESFITQLAKILEASTTLSDLKDQEDRLIALTGFIKMQFTMPAQVSSSNICQDVIPAARSESPVLKV